MCSIVHLLIYSLMCLDGLFVFLKFHKAEYCNHYHVIGYAWNYNRANEYNGDGWDGERGFGGRARGWAKDCGFSSGQGYGGQLRGFYNYVELGAT